MSKVVSFYFDVGSPTSYLAWTQLPSIAEEAKATIDWHPVLLGGIFKATHNQSPAAIPAKAAYMLQDLQRFAPRYGVSFRMNPHFPINTLLLMRAVKAVQMHQPESFMRFLKVVYEKLWVEGQNLAEPHLAIDTMKTLGLDPDELMNAMESSAVKDALREETDQAVRRGVFGVPTMIVGHEMFWGQDRLDFVREALR